MLREQMGCIKSISHPKDFLCFQAGSFCGVFAGCGVKAGKSDKMPETYSEELTKLSGIK
jgi:hypothetical protein